MISTDPDEGGSAWTWVEYGHDGPPPRTAHCAPDCGYHHAPACWIEAVFDTGDGYRGGPAALHQRLVTGLGA